MKASWLLGDGFNVWTGFVSAMFSLIPIRTMQVSTVVTDGRQEIHADWPKFNRIQAQSH